MTDGGAWNPRGRAYVRHSYDLIAKLGTRYLVLVAGSRTYGTRLLYFHVHTAT